MKCVIGLRTGGNLTNMRSEALSEALRSAGHSIEHIGRSSTLRGNTDLYVQSGFASTPALLSAIDQSIPYIIMEAPVFRCYDLMTHSSWGYNGLQGGAWRPSSPEGERPKPELKALHDGPQLIIGQKPTDHSLRGSDHVKWIEEKRASLPQADFRPHPLMVHSGSQESIELALERYGEVFTYSSTVGVDAVVAGAKAYADSGCSLLRHHTASREEFLHELSWFQAGHSDYGQLIDHILSGYEEARERMINGLYETPRGKVDGQAIQRQYDRLVLPVTVNEGT